MRNRAVRRAECYIGLVVLAGVSSAAGAQETRTGLLVSTGVSVESNPYNGVSREGVGVAATAELRPIMQVRDERTTIDLTGSAQFRQFFNDYGLEDNYSADARLVTRVTEQITLRTTGAAAYTVGGYSNFGRPGLSPNNPIEITPETPIPDPSLSDVAILGQRTRVKAFDMGVGADTKLNTYSSLSLDFTGRAMRFRTVGFNDYNNITAQLAYSHQLSEFTSLGLIGSVSRSDYIDTPQGDTRTISILGSVEHRLGANWSLSASGGASFSRMDQQLGQPDQKFTSLTARMRFCRFGEFSQFCLSANRSPEPSANGSVRVSNSISADYSLRVSDRENVTLTGAFARTGRGRGPLAAQPAVKFLSASAGYNRVITEKLTGFISSSFSKIYSPLAPRRVNLGLNAGVRFRFGALQ